MEFSGNWQDADDLDFGTSEDVDTETPETDYAQPEEPAADIPGYQAVMGAPDYKDIVGKRQSGKSREYERKIQSVEKAVALGAIRRNNFADAAAIFKDGPAFARAAGDAAAQNERVAKVIDMVTAPDNPTAILILTGIALGGQLLRNHEPQIEEVSNKVKVGWLRRREARKAGTKLINPKPPVASTTIKIPFKRKPITINWRLKFPAVGTLFKGAFASAIDPRLLTHSVFSDPDLIKALEKEGITIGVQDPNARADAEE